MAEEDVLAAIAEVKALLDKFFDGTGVLAVKSLTIINNAGNAVTLQSTGGNGYGLQVEGNGTGEGIRAAGGATGHGIQAVGGVTSGHGLFAMASAAGQVGILAQGNGAGQGIYALAGDTGDGFRAKGGTTSGHGFHAVATDGNGIQAIAGGTDDHGLYVAGAGAGEGIRAIGGATGNGIQAVGGGTSGSGIYASATDGHGAILVAGNNGQGLSANGAGTGSGVQAIGGATGAGVMGRGGATSGPGIYGLHGAGNNGSGILAVGTGTGNADILADITGSITGNMSGSVGSVTTDVTLGSEYGVTTAEVQAAAQAAIVAEGVATATALAEAKTVVDGIAADYAKTGEAASAVASLGYVAPDNVSAQAAAASAASADGKLTAERLAKLDGAAQEATVDALNDFDPATDVVAHVTLVDTTTTNTDMRGTDNAMLAASYTAPPTAAQNADAVWDEAVADHVTSGTFGRFLQRVYRYFFNKTLHTNTSMVVYADDGTTSDAVMAVSGDTSSVTKGAAS